MSRANRASAQKQTHAQASLPASSSPAPERLSQAAEGKDSVGRNSIIMASGTAASRVTGQIRTILLAAAIGTTGIAADAYQTGAMIPQVMFTLISGGIFNAVLVPQIVRTLKEEDAEDRLNKLITASIALLAGLTLILMLGTSVLTSIYLNSKWNPAQRALANAFTLWCMPQVFFYGLYTVLGQILAAKGRFTAYAWSSVAANAISCGGFLAFIAMFGNAQKQPMDFWTTEKVGLTAGAWTLGVAFQALVLFIPLIQSGFTYRPRWGLKGIGLRSMGPVAAWSLGVVVIDQLANIVNARITNGAPLEGDPFDIAGNGSYQNAYTLYMLPYSLIAVSVSTAIFPLLSQAIAENRIDDARQALSRALRNVGLMMCFFGVVMLVIPVPIIRALLPSVSVHEAVLISGPLLGLTVGLAAVSAFLLIQRTFYAFEDGKQPFIFAAISNTLQVGMVLVAVRLAPPRYWTTLVGLSLALSNIVSFPFLVHMLKRRFEGFLDGRRIVATYCKALLAAIVAGGLALLVKTPLTKLAGAEVSGRQGHMSWVQAVFICLVISVLVGAVYFLLLCLLRTSELTDLLNGLTRRLGVGEKTNSKSARTGSIPAVSSLPADPTAQESELAGQPIRVIRSYTQPAIGSELEGALEQIENVAMADAGSMNPRVWKQPARIVPKLPPRKTLQRKATEPATPTPATPAAAPISQTTGQRAGDRQSNLASAPIPAAPPSGAPLAKPTEPSPSFALPSEGTAWPQPSALSTQPSPAAHENSGTMEPSTSDILLDRYQLKTLLKRGPGLSVWQAQDKVLDRPCQLFLVTDASALEPVGAAASAMALKPNRRFTPVYQLHARDGIALVVTGLDEGTSLREFLENQEPAQRPSFEAIRTIVGESAQDLTTLRQAGLTNLSLSPSLIRLAAPRICIADASVFSMLKPWLPSRTEDDNGSESLAIRQLSGILYALLTGSIPNDSSESLSLQALPADVPEAFSIICERGLGLRAPERPAPTRLVTLAELTALLGSWTPPEELGERDIHWPQGSGSASIETVRLKPVAQRDRLPIPASLMITGRTASRTLAEPRWGANQLLFPGRGEVQMVNPAESDADLFSMFDERKLQNRRSSSAPLGQSERSTWPTRMVDASELRRVGSSDFSDTASTTAGGQRSLANKGKQEPEDDQGTDLFARIPARPLAGQGNQAARSAVPAMVWDFADTGEINLARPQETDPADLPDKQAEDAQAIATGAGAGSPAHAQAESVLDLPPSFAPGSAEQAINVRSQRGPFGLDEPGDDRDDEDDEDVADARLFGRFTTKSVVIAVASCLVVIGLIWASLTLVGHRRPKEGKASGWPQMSNVPFPGHKSDSSDSSSTAQPQQPEEGEKAGQKSGEASPAPTVKHGTKSASAVPAPRQPTNTTAYPTLRQTFLSHPAGQPGFAWYVHLDAPHEVSRVEVSIRQQGGHAQIFANASASQPTPGQSLADFSFDPSGVSRVTLTKPVTTQDLIIWVPQDGLPAGGTLHFNEVKVY
ncbi:putative integral membrane protein MviN [Bifidobacterium actinocoloniiforme DSM 22766]|uniref:Putative integral membrane protein MviN n=1 Tax=Bifidobacterium actinocoloniiforme DSM 22766 TaxID=1437605 RepID=A0A086Z2M3_9BIFI|nr:murein biosynthesis integral membrane protein MurJ [Bifidobacterium actinocoloniiforme]KFI40773.1 putative integral membrane protein MviN [Bifidobacterium actinocoloniiforme DSM 22766]